MTGSTAGERARLPWVTLVAMLLIGAAFAAEVARGVDAWRPSAAELAQVGGPVDGLAWRLAIAPLVHLGVLHLAFNLIGFALVGPPLERALGRAATALIFAGGALVGAAASYAAYPFATTIGASAATFAAATALVVVLARGDRASARRGAAIRLGVFALLHAIAWTIYTAWGIGAEPDGWAHAAGAAAGLAIALIAGRAAPVLRILAAAAAIVAALAIVIALPASPVDWRADELRAAAIERHFDEIVPPSLSGPEPALARRVDAEVIAPLAAIRDAIHDDARVPAAIAHRRAALRAYLDARLRALRAVVRYLDTGDRTALAEFDAANRDADRALAAP